MDFVSCAVTIAVPPKWDAGHPGWGAGLARPECANAQPQRRTVECLHETADQTGRGCQSGRRLVKNE